MKEDVKMTINDFELLRTIGKDSLGKIIEVLSMLKKMMIRCAWKPQGRSMPWK